MDENFISYYSAELLDEVIAKCRDLLQGRPNDPQLYADLGNSFLRKGNFREAHEAYQKALDLNPQDASLHVSMGQCQSCLKNHEKAKFSFQNAIAQHPEWPDAHFWLGVTCVELGQGDEAIPHFERAINISPGYKAALFQLALVYEGKKDFEKANSYLKKCLAMAAPSHSLKRPFPYHIEILFDNPVLVDEAVRQLSSFLRDKEGFADLRFKLGMAYRRKGMKAEAMREFKKALKINPNYQLARHYYWNWEDDLRADSGPRSDGFPR